MISKGLKTLLLAQASVTAITGNRIFVSAAKQGTTGTYIVIDRMSDEKYKGLDGVQTAKQAEVDIECWARTPESAAALAKVVSDYLDDFQGATGGAETILASHQVDDSDNYVAPTSGGEITEFVTILNFEFMYTE
jgi:hypothetical protein